ncbi:MAG: glycerol-3-phosphate dehydrogenase/oxidase [Chromatiales bacterium]
MSVETCDVAVIGAGIHGAGVAQAAAAAGHRVLVLEKSNPAAGTSSCSSKLIHGGLRYLKSGQFSLVRESLRERELLLRNAPDLVRLVPFYIPVYQDTSHRPWMLRTGLALYALLGGFAAGTRFATVPKGLWHRLGGLRQEKLRSVFTYFDAQTDDALLTRAVLASACRLGAHMEVPARLERAIREKEGYLLSYSAGGTQRECRATVVVNAAGPWVNIVQARCSPQPRTIAVELVQGTHLVYDRPVATGVFYVEAPRDRRPVFVMPWRDGTLVGTTETVFEGDPDQVAPRMEEIAYLQETLASYFPRYRGAMIGTMAGLRVLPASAAQPHRRSRDTLLVADNERRPHWLAIYGGKLTAYRATAEKVLRHIASSLPVREPITDTRSVRLSLQTPV